MAYEHYVDSSSVTVFPTTGRTAEFQRSARHLSERNITDITNKITDNNSYSLGGIEPIQFVLNGYLFTVSADELAGGDSALTKVLRAASASDAIDSNISEVWAHIVVLESGSSRDYAMLQGQDEIPQGGSISYYTGVEFLSEAPQSRAITLKILEYVRDVGWQVPKDSLIKFAQNSIDITVIDGGII